MYGSLKIRKQNAFPNQVSDLLGAVTRQMLHARHLEFLHPAKSVMLSFEGPIPRDMQTVIDALVRFRYDSASAAIVLNKG